MFYRKLIAILLFAILLNNLFKPIPLNGDSLEYIIQTQSLVFDQSIEILRDKRANYWNTTNPYNRELTLINFDKTNTELIENNQAGGGFGSLYRTKKMNFIMFTLGYIRYL